MNGRRIATLLAASFVAVACLVTLGGRLVPAQDSGTSQPFLPPPDLKPPPEPAAPGGATTAAGEEEDKNTEVLTRGAVHEAFAQPVVFDAAPSALIPKQPPDPVEELPPDQKPAGDHVVWIPGYWSWEQDQTRFIWISGIWRALPAGYDWVPGYWAKKDDGAQWVAGFWRHGETAEVNYLPQPPQCLETGPVGAAPSPDQVWIPGVWIWRGSKYIWRPGYWAVCQPGWIWVPSHYVWTPSGYVFVEGHWDYELQRRGMIFAPVVFRPGVTFVGYAYTPGVVVDCNMFTGCLFCRPRCCCYCYGDYYGPEYVQAGFYPWFSFHMSRYGYDPCFAYYNWHYGRNNPGWRERLVYDYRFRRDHFEARPARTYAAMRISGGGISFAVSFRVAVGRGGPMHFEHVSAARRAEIRRAVHEAHAQNERRAEMERRNAGRAGAGPNRMTVPKSSVGASAAAARTTSQQKAATQNKANQQKRPTSRSTQRSTSRGRPEER